MKEALSSSDTSVLTTATRRNIQKKTFFTEEFRCYHGVTKYFRRVLATTPRDWLILVYERNRSVLHMRVLEGETAVKKCLRFEGGAHFCVSDIWIEKNGVFWDVTPCGSGKN
jgi:hypothetical protein